ncbi:MAG TPA: membrane protein insertase YidC [Kofleriaceae bacterium]|nr:membrane protein insertase YidC [Kofleriaceae bacterium]
MEDQGKRLLLAVAVAFAIMLAWQFLFPPEKPAPEEKPAAEQESGERAERDRGEADAPARAAEEPEPARPRGPEETITLESPEVRAVFSSWGGALKSWELLGDQFHVPGDPGQPEDLARLAAEGFYSFQVGFDDGSTYRVPDGAEWKGEKTGEREVTYTWRSENLSVEKRFRLRPEDYLLEMDIRYEVLGGEAEQELAVTLYGFQDPREVKEGGWTSLPREWKAACYVDGELESWSGKTVAEREREERGHVEWAGFLHSYFLAAAAPRVDDGKVMRCRADAAGEEPGGMRLQIVWPTAQLDAGTGVQAGVVAYLGPKYLDKLEAISQVAEFDTGLEKSVDLGFWGFIAGPLLWLLQTFHGWVGSWGIAIIMLTILVKLATLYWTHKSMKSMRAMSKLKPQLDKIREKYKDDRQKQQVETMNLFKAHGVNPLAGCLPMVLQMPIWFALYRALSVAAELYQAKFLWFEDLTSPDPYYILPVFMTLTMLLQSRLTPTTATGAQQKILTFGMPLMFGGFSLFFPAGLTLYISTNTVLTLLHHLYMRKGELGGGRDGKGAAGKVEALAAATAAGGRDEEDEEPAADRAPASSAPARRPGAGGGRGSRGGKSKGGGKGKGGKGGKRSKRSSRSP